MAINAEWHRANPMPRNASLAQRIAWHVAHAAACGCRAMPESIRQEAVRRGLIDSGRGNGATRPTTSS